MPQAPLVSQACIMYTLSVLNLSIEETLLPDSVRVCVHFTPMQKHPLVLQAWGVSEWSFTETLGLLISW
jgi:hypothetical protein